jgi:hypothetical protein
VCTHGTVRKGGAEVAARSRRLLQEVRLGLARVLLPLQVVVGAQRLAEGVRQPVRGHEGGERVHAVLVRGGGGVEVGDGDRDLERSRLGEIGGDGAERRASAGAGATSPISPALMATPKRTTKSQSSVSAAPVGTMSPIGHTSSVAIEA